VIGVPAVLVAVRIGVTVPKPLLATWTVLPSGVIAMSSGTLPVLIAVPAVLVAVAIGVTVSEPELAT
jgi:hypothetical protein